MQAARGASLSTDGATSAPTRIGLFAGVAASVLALDQLTKAYALANFDAGDPQTVIPGLIRFTLHFNPGAAFSTGTGFTVVLTAIAIVVSLVVLRMARRLRDRGWAVGLGLLLGGAVGNLVDRLVRDPAPFRGHVVDFIDYAGFFVGNVADIALTFAAVVIIVRSWRGIGLDGQRTQER